MGTKVKVKPQVHATGVWKRGDVQRKVKGKENSAVSSAN
jgi:hypothetical protein